MVRGRPYSQTERVEGSRGRRVMRNTEEKGKGSLEARGGEDVLWRPAHAGDAEWVRQTSGRQERKQEKGSGGCFLVLFPNSFMD